MKLLNKHSKAFDFILLLCIFWGQYLLFGLRRSVDLPTYEAFSPLVYPLYPSVLWIFRTLFGAETGYFLLGLFQNLLLVLSIHSLTGYLKKAFQPELWIHYLLIAVCSLVFIVQKWFTQAGLVTPNTLFSEAFSIPLYLFFFRYALQAVMERDMKAFLGACLFATGIILTRAQLYWVLAVMFLVRLYMADSSRKRAFLSAVLVCAIIAGFIQGTRVIQNLSEDDDQTKTPSSTYLLTTAVYCSTPEDAALFPANSAEQKLFVQTRSWMDDPELLAAFSYETGSFTQRHMKFETYYDGIKGVIHRNYYGLLEEGMVPNLTTMFIRLVLANPVAYLTHCGQNALTGLIRTVAILRPVINELACLFFVYILGCLLISRKLDILKKERQLACLGLLCVLLNTLIMAPGVFALSRYMFYNMPVMYITALLFLRGLFLAWKNRAR